MDNEQKKASGQIKFYKKHMQTARPSRTQGPADDKPSVRDVSWAGACVTLGCGAGGGAAQRKPRWRRVSSPLRCIARAQGPRNDSTVSCFSTPVTSPLSKSGNHNHISKNHSVFSLRFYRNFFSPHSNSLAKTMLKIDLVILFAFVGSPECLTAYMSSRCT